MAKKFTMVAPQALSDNPFKLIGSDWMLIAARSGKKINMMTAGWGGFGVLWNKQVCFCFIRPGRHTYSFIERAKTFTLSFFDEKYREDLNFCGTQSGRNVDKVKETGLTPVCKGKDTVYFKEARLVLVCKKIYFSQIDPAHFLDAGIAKNYPQKDYHRMYVGEIVSCLRKGL
jgi:flavin reductase (DIM6/NTAB) family NADH-FMN oxidoreductase RutF